MSIIHLRAAGSSFVLDARGTAVPAVLHWGADLGQLSESDLEQVADAAIPAVPGGSVDLPLRCRILPVLHDGWQGRPALSGHRSGRPEGMHFELDRLSIPESGAVSVSLRSGGLAVLLEYELTVEGLLVVRSSVANHGEDAFDLDELNVLLPVPARASEILDFSGKWAGERRPGRRAVNHGAWMRESRHGRTGHDAAYLMSVGTPAFGFRTGEIWSMHQGWSGNARNWVESSPLGATVIGAGELLAGGEVRLAPGERYAASPVYAAWSGSGLDAISERFHRALRRTRGFSSRPHPVILNTWEAVYFEHDELRLTELAAAAASLGVERFVLDDGWMNHRIDDRRALGDWTVDKERWPNGLGSLISQVRSLGMDFGLWVEPEMISLESDAARAHPEWVLSDTPIETALPARHQFVLDLQHPGAFDHVLAQLSALLDEYPIAYLKWDHNRDLFTSWSRQQTLAAYRLMDELQHRHPGVEIESCASGGGRIDLGMLQRTTRVWASDTNDALERQSIYRWTSLLVPPEVIGVHLGAATAHTTGRTHDLSFRLATALFGWAGIEWDITRATDAERAAVADWIAVYKDVRPLLASGTVVRADRADPALEVHGVVASDLSEAIFAVVSTSLGRDAVPAPVCFPGLDPDRHYRLSIVELGGGPRYFAARLPPWMTGDGLVLSGALLGRIGIAAPPLAPEQALVLRLQQAR